MLDCTPSRQYGSGNETTLVHDIPVVGLCMIGGTSMSIIAPGRL
jgi:hypothetical protein